MTTVLGILLGAVLLGPFLLPFAERHLEWYLFLLGVAAVLAAGVGNLTLVQTAMAEPVAITCAVFVAGGLFRIFQLPFSAAVTRAERVLPARLFTAVLVIGIGLISSFITAIVAAVLLVSIVSLLHYERQAQIRLVILSCYSIGLGAVLTPIGEPLSTIATSRLDESFFFLFSLLGQDVVVSLLTLGIIAAVLVPPAARLSGRTRPVEKESWRNIIDRSLHVYLFVMALTFLGAGFAPLLNPILEGKSPAFLYWANMISAVLDNATLASIELSPAMDDSSVRAILMGLLISGGMLIPGNIPNIIAAGKLSVTSKEWAVFGFPFGLGAMGVYFLLFVS